MHDCEAPARLTDGFRRFRRRYYEDESSLFHDLVHNGQSPRVMMIACSDSRVTPSLVFDTGPGELFVVRNVANLVPPAEFDDHRHGTSAALEFAVERLKVAHIIVQGHSRCGGIQSLLEGIGGQYTRPWLTIAARARAEVLAQHPQADPKDQAHALGQASILVSLENLLSFDNVRRAVVRGELTLHGWYFDLEAGRMLRYEGTSQRFENLA